MEKQLFQAHPPGQVSDSSVATLLSKPFPPLMPSAFPWLRLIPPVESSPSHHRDPCLGTQAALGGYGISILGDFPSFPESDLEKLAQFGSQPCFEQEDQRSGFRGPFQDSLVLDSVSQVCKNHRGFCSDLFAAVFSHLPHVQTPSKKSFWITIPPLAPLSTLSLPTHQSSFLSSQVTCPCSPSLWDVQELSEGCRGFSWCRVMPGTGTERILSSLLLSCVLSIPGKAAATRRKSCKEPHREQMKTTAPPWLRQFKQ